MTTKSLIANHNEDKLGMVGRANDAWVQRIANILHYPEHWDAVKYPTVYDVIEAIAACNACPSGDEIPPTTEKQQMTRTDRMIEELKNLIDGDNYFHTKAILTCIEIVRRIGNELPTEEEIVRVGLAIRDDDNYRNRTRWGLAKAALTAFLGQEGK